MDIDGLWETYQHIAKLHELGEDEQGNFWLQQDYILSMRPEHDYTTNYKFMESQNVCKTGMCFAGWYCCLKNAQVSYQGFVRDGNQVQEIARYVNEKAGLSHDDHKLFCGSNTLQNIRDELIELTGVDRG